MPDRRIALALAAAVFALSAAAFAAQEPPRPSGLVEEIDVARLLVEARVFDARGEVVRGLKARDFVVRVDGRPAEILDADWTDGAAPFEPLAVGVADKGQNAADALGPRAGRLVVLFFQRRINITREAGLMRLAHLAQRYVDGLAPTDRVAVVVYDSRLSLLEDFTSDHARVKKTIHDAVLPFERRAAGPGGPEPSLAAHWDEERAAQAGTCEAGLLAVARGLEEIGGPKTLLFFGWGLGRYTANGTIDQPEFADARRTLVAAHAAVSVVDYREAETHSLEAPMRALAAETGGAYVKTDISTDKALERAFATASGHYLLTLRKPPLGSGVHRIEAELTAPKGRTVYTRGFYRSE